MSAMQEIINQPETELKLQLEQLSKEIFEMENELRVSRKLDKPHELKERKRKIARILTALNQKKGK